jgi:hypothetical protein
VRTQWVCIWTLMGLCLLPLLFVLRPRRAVRNGTGERYVRLGRRRGAQRVARVGHAVWVGRPAVFVLPTAARRHARERLSNHHGACGRHHHPEHYCHQCVASCVWPGLKHEFARTHPRSNPGTPARATAKTSRWTPTVRRCPAARGVPPPPALAVAPIVRAPFCVCGCMCAHALSCRGGGCAKVRPIGAVPCALLRHV